MTINIVIINSSFELFHLIWTFIVIYGNMISSRITKGAAMVIWYFQTFSSIRPLDLSSKDAWSRFNSINQHQIFLFYMISKQIDCATFQIIKQALVNMQDSLMLLI